MRKLFLLALAVCFVIGAESNAQLLITGVVDGPLTGGLPKAIELFAYEAIPDLSIFGVGSANNGGGTDGEEFTFPAVSAAINSYIFVSADSAGFATFFEFDADYTTGAASINGDDAIELFKNGAVIDVFGEIDVDGTGQPWDHLDGWAYRNDNTGPDASTFVLASWSFSGINALDGETTNATAATPFPIQSFTTALPVELTSFSASVSNKSIKLSWNTATELNNYGFEIQRSFEKGKWENVGFVNGNGTSNSPKDYSFVDNKLSNSSSYFYRLKQVDNDGSYEFSKTIEVVLGAPISYKLDQNFPNPFNPSTIISFTLPEDGFTRLTVFNSLGQEVNSLVNENLEAGYHQFNFTGDNLTSGVYYYKLEAGNFVQINKMMLLK